MRKLVVGSLVCLALVGLVSQPAMAQNGHWVFGVSASPNTPVPAAAVSGFNAGQSSCADSIRQALAGPYNLKIVEASQGWAGAFAASVYTFVGDGKRTLILLCGTGIF